MKLNNASTSISNVNKTLTEIDSRLVDIAGRLSTALADMNAKKAIHDANELAIKEEARAMVVTVYNNLENELNELQDTIQRYSDEYNIPMVQEFEEKYTVKYAEFEVARLEMELINAEEARKAEE